MSTFRTTFIAIAMASSMLGVAPAWSGPLEALAASDTQPLKIVAFGSSSTQGIGASGPTATYPAQLQIALQQMMPPDRRITVLNRGIAGEDADDMVRRLRKDVIDRHPDIVIFQTGSNDPMRHVPLARFERETRDSIKAMQGAGITVLMMEPQWCPTLDKITAAVDYREMIRKIGTQMNVDVIRRSDLMHDWIKTRVLTKREMLAPDGLHMRDKGYALLARWVAAQVLKADAAKVRTRMPVTTQASL